MCFLDFRMEPSSDRFQEIAGGDDGDEGPREKWATMDLAATYTDRDIDAAFRKAAAPDFKARCLPACFASREVGLALPRSGR